MNTELNINTITFGKYKNKTIEDILKDRKYCKWLLDQEWFKINYEYLYNRVKEFNPKEYFIIKKEGKDFFETYPYFNLLPTDKIVLELTDIEKKCYEFYLCSIEELKQKILKRINESQNNFFDIKAPTKWLQKFEQNYGIKRDDFKEFINSYDLPNITSIVEDIKKEGGLVYKGAKSFLIAKENSEIQEKFWENILKNKYGEDIGNQFKYQNCIFDFINIPLNTIYECKIGLKDFNEDQYIKYLTVLNKYKIIYLIANDCVIDMNNKIMYTTDLYKYLLYQIDITFISKSTKFDEIIENCEIIEITDIDFAI